MLQRGDGLLSDRDYLGHSIAVQGDWLLAGAPADSGAAGAGQGSAYIYKRVDGQWQLLQKVVAPDAEAHDQFGTAIAISGVRFVIAARGALYVYHWIGDEYLLEACIAGPEDAYGMFGEVIAMGDDRIIVGARHATVDGYAYAGAAYIYARNDGQWVEQARLTASDPVEDAYFGISVAIDGTRAVVGAYQANQHRGAAYVFNESSGTWLEESRLVADDYGSGSWFGLSVGIDGNRIAVGAPKVDNPGGAQVGRVFMFSLEGNEWQRTAALHADVPLRSSRFGALLQLHGTRMAIGAHSESDGDMENNGAAYLFYLNDGEWSQALRLVASDAHSNQHFGMGAVTFNGSQFVVGVPWDGNGSGMMTGAVYCYDVRCPGDVDGDWDVDSTDLATLLSSYGISSGATREDGDFDGDGDVDISDLATLLGCWGGVCP